MLDICCGYQWRRRKKIRMTTGRHRRQGRRRAGVPAPPHVDNAARACSDSDGIIDAIRQPLIVLDEKLRVISANEAFYRIFAVTRGETVGRHLVAIGDRRLDVSALRDFLDLTQAKGALIEDYEIEIELPALGRRVLRLNGRPIRREPFATREILVTIDDVTERQRAETMLKSAKWHAERANLGKSRFLAGASHDLRQPLQTLSLLRGTLAKKIKDKKNEEALKLVAMLNETADALEGMLDTLLDINQLEAGMVQPEKVNFPINDLLEQLRIDFAYHARVHGLLWRVVPCGSSVWSDPRLLGQMIRNLLSNAVKYTERGKILLGCRRRGDKLRIEVWDTGPGVPGGELQAIFEDFHQLDNPARERSRGLGLGLGLGLSIVQRLGNLLGHTVDVHSRPGKGSVFTVETQLGREQPGAPPRPRRWGAVQNAASDPAILVVEDDPSVRELLDLLFRNEGYRTVAAADGKQALALARGAIRPDLVVADFGLPSGLTGLQVIAGVREAVGREIPAVILTGDISTDTMREIARRGCVARNKPVKAEELTHFIRSLLTEPWQPTVQARSPPEADTKRDMLQPTIFVVDDEGSVREAMCGLLQEEGWLVEVYSSGEAFLEAYDPGREGCLVVDARMPRISGLELLERLKSAGSALPAIMITGHADIRLAVRAMKAGAMAFLEKPVQYDELVVNIERAMELTRNSVAHSSLRAAAARRIAGLTSRERQVVEMVVEGNPNKQIAYVLGISQRTVETHRATAMKKVGARTLSELIHLTIAGSMHDAL
jgi:two-component system, chemotaxis family, CheB/CheR fusion protein